MSVFVVNLRHICPEYCNYSILSGKITWIVGTMSKAGMNEKESKQ